MKRVLGILLLALTLSSFVMAGSEISMDFVIGEGEAARAGDYILPTGFWNNYGDYVITVLVVLVLAYAAIKVKNKNVHHKKKKRASKGKGKVKKKK